MANYVSTRSDYSISDTAALLRGIAPDGGLFALKEIAPFDYKSVMGLSYSEMAAKVMGHLMPGFAQCMDETVKVYPKKFDTDEITPLKDVGNKHILELWHGPTSAFKDLALSVLPLFMTYAKNAEGLKEKIVILTATSGDTGKAALEGFHDVDGTEIVVFFPHGGVSETQRLQMVTQQGKNVRVYAVRGNFDDCQRGVKEAFAVKDPGVYLSSANSINIGRLVPQAVYYFYAYSKLNTDAIVDFVVPTGNFGDILAGYLAKKMGLPVGKLICASNANNVLYDFLNTGIYDRRRELVKTTSPSMDILVSSNLERLLYYASDCDCDYVAYLMKELNEKGFYKVNDDTMNEICKTFSAAYTDEQTCLKTIGDVWSKYNYLIDPHTSVAYAGAPEGAVVLSTASPFKFSSAVSKAIGMDISKTGLEAPVNLRDLDKREILHNTVIDKNEIVEVAINK